MRRVPGALTVALVLAALWISAAGAAHAQRYPVVYNFFSGIPYELTNPGGSLPGANDWSCRPSAEHPNPVVLAHGTGGGAQTNWGVYAPLLANEGYCVYALTTGAHAVPWPLSEIGGMRPIQESSAQLAAFVDRVLAATGARRVDIVGHSQGNFTGNYFVKKLGGAPKVDKLVAIAPPWLGTNAGGVGTAAQFADRLGIGAAFRSGLGDQLCMACPQMFQGSPFLTDLNAGGVYHPDVTYTNIATRYDEAVVPHTNGLVPAPNATNIEVQDGCAQDFTEHAGIAGSMRTAHFVLNALDPAHPRPVPCVFAAPFTG
ncbi:alpha/beta fold hydrolase [Nocardia puris]|uniref:Lipase (Class 2) n=1 Tax=Nocardia puris TaxID=208602 RepID=A0A366DBH0_9NOCA|nr:alpha/beta fold hydrolase [Nocardia puris]MBF6214569.1 alpha/beta fold hydrolase [Nocardia puris]MBF6365978.1 alpha/beta fold hydrolase [Nocardia puris]MBF6460379.1 alpha/beta fold hydrolase [Nocardia puris]RBO87373.1 lipase (class 2) [Nocardia puris]